MGLLFGAKLSANADTVLIGHNPSHVREIQEKGVTVREGERTLHYAMKAAVNGECHEPADLIILFTKAYQNDDALKDSRNLNGENTYVLTLQNGMGHEGVLSRHVRMDHVLIGMTEQGSSKEGICSIVHSGTGTTSFARAQGTKGSETDSERLNEFCRVFEASGFPCSISENIRYMIWNKLMINASSSVLSGVLQKPQGYVAENEWAWSICRDLIREICETASGEEFEFDVQEQTERIYRHLNRAKNGYTSVYADLKYGRKTEADYISGAVVKAAEAQGKTVPAQSLILRLLHAMEQQ